MALSVRPKGLYLHLHVDPGTGVEQPATLHLEPSGFLAASIPAGENARELARLSLPILEQAIERIRAWGNKDEASASKGTD